jgi:hypothetical protein
MAMFITITWVCKKCGAVYSEPMEVFPGYVGVPDARPDTWVDKDTCGDCAV